MVLELKKPHEGAIVDGMEFTDYLFWKAVVIMVGAAVYGFWRGFTHRD
jgi:hypothetical protein